jgi:hypothetical protein
VRWRTTIFSSGGSLLHHLGKEPFERLVLHEILVELGVVTHHGEARPFACLCTARPVFPVFGD